MDVTSQRAAVDLARLLVDAVQRLSSCRTLEEIIAVAQSVARRGTEADGVSFVLPEGDQCFYADEDAIAPLWKGRRFPMTECVSGWAMKNRSVAVIPDIRLDDRVPQATYRVTFVRSLVVMPIHSREPFGAIGVYWAQPQTPARALLDWLQALADVTCASFETVRARREIEELRNSASPFPPDAGPIRMCAWTRRLWHNGQWLTIEAFLHQRFGLEITHGISDEARQRFTAALDIRPTSPTDGPRPT